MGNGMVYLQISSNIIKNRVNAPSYLTSPRLLKKQREFGNLLKCRINKGAVQFARKVYFVLHDQAGSQYEKCEHPTCEINRTKLGGAMSEITPQADTLCVIQEGFNEQR